MGRRLQPTRGQAALALKFFPALRAPIRGQLAQFTGADTASKLTVEHLSNDYHIIGLVLTTHKMAGLGRLSNTEPHFTYRCLCHDLESPNTAFCISASSTNKFRCVVEQFAWPITLYRSTHGLPSIRAISAGVRP